MSSGNFVNALKPSNGLLRPKYSTEVSSKLYSGLQTVKELDKKEDFLAQVDVSLTSYVEEASFYKFAVTEMVAPKYKNDTKDLLTKDKQNRLFNSSPAAQENSSVDPGDTLERINKELCDITEPVTDSILSKLTSASIVDTPELRRSITSSGKSIFSFDLAKYYLQDVSSSPDEKRMTWYQTRETVKYVDNFDVTCQVVLNKRNKDQNLIVRFDLYKRESNVVDETYTANFYMTNHIEAYGVISSAPSVMASQQIKENTKNNQNTYFIQISDTEKRGKISKFNLYLKSITQKGSTSTYAKIDEVVNSGIVQYSLNTTCNLSVLRVVPVDNSNQESTVFTNVVLGPGYRAIGNLTIVASHFGSSEIRIDVFNVPKFSSSLVVYRRDCTENPDSPFLPIKKVRVQYKNTITTVVDKDVNPSRVYEYYAISTLIDEDRKQEIAEVSNFAMFRSYPSVTDDKSVTVSVSNHRFTTGLSGDRSVSFTISTKVSPTENEKITKSLKEQLGELYEQYLNPSNNSASPLDDSKGVPQYADLFLHEVVRTNLNTGDRETFSLVTDGLFQDSNETRKNMGIAPINPQFSYHYQVFTYKKNPIEIFKKFVARGEDAKGREWFYLPYKWRNPAVRFGHLYAEGEDGIPIIDSYENYTSEALGLTASYQVDGSAAFASLDQIQARRIDRNTVKLTWKFTGTGTDKYTDLYDSFVVMKVVNGVRKFVGKTHKDYIYHDLTSEDIGTIYYIVVPVMIEFDIDAPGFSNSLVIQPDGLSERIKQPPEKGVRSENGKVIL